MDAPGSESEPSNTATDAPRVSGNPLGNVALTGTFFPPNETKPAKDLIIQHGPINKHNVETNHLSLKIFQPWWWKKKRWD